MGTVHTRESQSVGVHLTLDRATLTRLDAAAQRARLTRSALLREMIEELLEREDEARWLTERAEAELAEERLPLRVGLRADAQGAPGGGTRDRGRRA